MKRFILIFFILLNAHVTVYSQDYLQMMQMMQMMQNMQIDNMINSAINNYKNIQTRISWSPVSTGLNFHLYCYSISGINIKLAVNRKVPDSGKSWVERKGTTNSEFLIGEGKGVDLTWKIESGDKFTWYVNDQYEGSYTFPDNQSSFNGLVAYYKNEFESFINSSSATPSSFPASTFSAPGSTPSSSSSSGYVICKSCKGTGKCGTCSGSGYYQGSYGTGTLKCPNCSERDGRICSVCNGTGKWFLK